MTDSTGVLQIFTRDPVPGKTKTRLIPLLGEQGAADLHRRILTQIIYAASDSLFEYIELWGTSDPDKSILQEFVQHTRLQLFKQNGNDLGDRMYNSGMQALNHNEFVVIIGSDCPLLSSQILDKAYRALAQGSDAVLGPTDDGGYYLIGLRCIDFSIFEDIHWGNADVADKTRAKMKILGWNWQELDYLWDIDTPEDIKKIEKTELFSLFSTESA